jgi:hypothetical protein
MLSQDLLPHGSREGQAGGLKVASKRTNAQSQKNA